MKQYRSAELAYEATKKAKTIAVCVKTYTGDKLSTTEYYAYKSKYEYPADLREDFPIPLGSNQSIEEIDQFY